MSPLGLRVYNIEFLFKKKNHDGYTFSNNSRKTIKRVNIGFNFDVFFLFTGEDACLFFPPKQQNQIVTWLYFSSIASWIIDIYSFPKKSTLVFFFYYKKCTFRRYVLSRKIDGNASLETITLIR